LQRIIGLLNETHKYLIIHQLWRLYLEFWLCVIRQF